MFKDTQAFSSFSVDDLARAKAFYGKTLGLEATEIGMTEGVSILMLRLGKGGRVLIYPKPDHTPSTFTVLNFPVEKRHGERREHDPDAERPYAARR
jgi:catechol 2,3-dioxygenase-like lactoylglutathione lyase family enzyme